MATKAAAGTKRKAGEGPGKGKGGYDVPWVEKYRPRNLDDVVGNEDTLVRLRAIAEDGNMPNLILCGPPGTGKVRALVVFCVWMMLFASVSLLREVPTFGVCVVIVASRNGASNGPCHCSLLLPFTPTPRPRASTPSPGNCSDPLTPMACLN